MLTCAATTVASVIRKMVSEMEFGPVPDAAKRAHPNAVARVIGPPLGMADLVGSAEALVDNQTELGRGFRLYCKPSEAEIEDLKNGGFLEFVVYAVQMPPVSVGVWGWSNDGDVIEGELVKEG